jgi:hypothetical protein
MKKFLGLLALILLLNGCNDGDLKVEAINFDNATAQSCGEIIYKLKETEALFIKIPEGTNAFVNEITPENTPVVIPIGSNVIVRYRSYNGNVTSDNICPNVVQPITPIATVEWVALSGTIEITTTAVWSTADPVTGATKLLQYNHNIVFKNIIFATPTGQQVYNTFSFGDYATDATPLPLGFLPDNVRLCPSGTTLYNAANGGIEGMFIQNIDLALFSTSVLNTPKTALISETANKLSYRLFDTALPTGLNDDYFCSDPLPATPVVNQEWIAENGVTNTSGIIEVTTTTNGPAIFKHTIRLKGVTFRRGGVTFYYGNDILFGELNQ